MASKYANGLTARDYVGLLKADFAGLENLEEIVNKALYRIMVKDYNKSAASKYGVPFSQWKEEGLNESGGFADLIRNELGKTLGIIRANAVKRVREGMKNDRGAAQGAVLRTFYKDRLGAAVHIMGKRRRLSSRERDYTPGHQRDVNKRTEQINKYFGPDRAFILRILESGRGEYIAYPSNGKVGRGSRSTYGRRCSLPPQSRFGNVGNEVDIAAQELGNKLVGYVREYVQEEINSNN